MSSLGQHPTRPCFPCNCGRSHRAPHKLHAERSLNALCESASEKIDARRSSNAFCGPASEKKEKEKGKKKTKRKKEKKRKKRKRGYVDVRAEAYAKSYAAEVASIICVMHGRMKRAPVARSAACSWDRRSIRPRGVSSAVPVQ